MLETIVAIFSDFRPGDYAMWAGLLTLLCVVVASVSIVDYFYWRRYFEEEDGSGENEQ